MKSLRVMQNCTKTCLSFALIVDQHNVWRHYQHIRPVRKWYYMIILSIKGINGVSYAKQRMPKSIPSFSLSLPLFDVNKAPHDY